MVYSLLSAYNSSFSVEPQTGLLRINRPLDRETQPNHFLTVQVVDGSSLHDKQSEFRFTSTANFTIRLLDINDSPPEFLTNMTYLIGISEMAAVGTKLTQVKAISRDEGPNSIIRFRLLTKQVEFELNETTG